jgi:DNA polymerase-3 subunit alpha
MIFSEDYLKMKHFLIPGSYIMVKARVGYRFNSEDQLEVKIMGMNLLPETIDKFTSSITLKLSNTEVDEGIIQKVQKLMKANPGKCEVKFRITDPEENTSVELKAKNNRVSASQFVRDLTKELNIEFKLS